nr:Glycosyltransferase and Endonuclease V domain containing protein [Haemonchus contortus]
MCQVRMSGTYGLSSWQAVSVATSVLIALKVLLIPTYTSTDFEVHRNWMAITHNLPLSKWYYESTSEWTLDYPPFFAYFEKCLATVAYFCGLEDILTLQKGALFNNRVLYFQRLSVIAADIFYILSCVIFCFADSPRWEALPKKLQPKARIAAFVVLSCHSGLLLIDSIHFQYNAMLTGLFILSIYFADCENFLLSALLYCTLLNFKHIYLYYAPAYVVFLLRRYFFRCFDDLLEFTRTISSGIKLATVMAVPFILSFGPFIYAGGLRGFIQILSRLFPVSRGLTHAYWAPNFWAIYNIIDLMLYRLLSLWKPQLFVAPTYSSGLVQEYEHSVLPTITPLLSLMCVLSSLAPLFATMFKKKLPDFCTLLSLSSFPFFWFGYHVHEKAVLLIAIPLLCVAFTDPKFIRLAVLFSIITATSLFPLLFTLFEVPIKYCASATYLVILLLMIRHVFRIDIQSLMILPTLVYVLGLIFIEFYATFLHQALFKASLAFFPLMIISVYNAAGVLFCYLWLILLVFDDDIGVAYKKKHCELIEGFIRAGHYPVQTVESLEEVEVVGGIDISASKHNNGFAVVAFSVFEYPTMRPLAIFDDVVVITEPYITDYLAVREANPVANFVNQVLTDYPQFRPDVLLCDGNGQFHIRRCGLACHIGALTGIATVGVAKNLNLSLLKAAGADDDVLKSADEVIANVSSQSSDGYIPFDLILPVLMNVTRLGGSKVPVFVSAGYGIELDLATQLVITTARNRICEPIRSADLHSREKVREYFDN